MRRRVVQGVAGLWVLLVSVSLTGCWSTIPIGHRALVQMLAVDPAPGGQLRVAVAVPSPQQLSLASGGEAGGTSESQVQVVEVTAPSLATAFTNMQSQLSRDVFFGQMEQVLLAENLTPLQVSDVLDQLAHTPELDQSQIVFAVRGPANRAMKVPNPQEMFPSTYLEHLDSCGTCTIVHLAPKILLTFVASRVPWGSFLLPEVDPTPLGPAVQGVAVYAGSRLVARLSLEEAGLLGLLTGDTVKLGQDVPVPSLGAVAHLRELHARVHLHAFWQGGVPAAVDQVEVTGQLVGLTPDPGLPYADVALPLEAAVAHTLLSRSLAVLAKVQARGGDPLHLGARLFSADPSRYPRGLSWSQVMRRARVRVRLAVRLVSGGQAR